MEEKIYKFDEYILEDSDSKIDTKEELEEIETQNSEKDGVEEKEDIEIESFIDIMSEEDLEKYDGEIIDLQENLTKHMDMDGKDYKRGDTIYITALVRKSKSTSFNSPAKTAVLKCRIVDIHYGLQYLKKAINK